MANWTTKLECVPLADWDEIPLKQTVKLFHANQSMQDAQIEMIIRRGEKVMVGAKMASEHLELALKKRHLKRAFVRANGVVKENRASKLLNREKMGEHVKVILALANQISHVRRDTVKHHRVKEEMDIYVQKYSQKYERFLEKVATESSEFHSVRDILDRFENLEQCRRECEQMVEEEMRADSRIRKEMSQLMMEKSTILKKLNNSLETITVRYKEARDKRMMWEHALRRLQGYWSTVNSKTEEISNGCNDLYTKIYHRRGARTTEACNSTRAQLHYIKTSISFFKEVLRLASYNQEENMVKMRSLGLDESIEENKKPHSQRTISFG